MKVGHVHEFLGRHFSQVGGDLAQQQLGNAAVRPMPVGRGKPWESLLGGSSQLGSG